MKNYSGYLGTAILTALLLTSTAFAQKAEQPETIEKQKVHQHTSNSEKETYSPRYVERAASNYDRYQYRSPGNESRYDTSQAWSRGRHGYWWGGYYGHRSDIPTSGYTPPATK